MPVPVEWIGRGSAFALCVYGDSMIGAGVQEGDIVIVRRQNTAEEGDVVAATIDAETTLKRLRHRGEQIVLMAENPAYSEIPTNETDFVIHGVVVGLLRKFSGSRPSRSSRIDRVRVHEQVREHQPLPPHGVGTPEPKAARGR